jgi:hypothetical protein
MLKGELSTSPVLLVQNVVPDENQGVNGALGSLQHAAVVPEPSGYVAAADIQATRVI